MEIGNNKKNVKFSENIDSSINGFSIVIAFIGIGTFLAYNNDYFGISLISNIVKWIFIVIGGIGLCLEISNLRKNKTKKQIQGISDLILGVVFLLIWWLIYTNFNIWYANIINFLFLILGLYGSSRGILEIGYSIINLNRNNQKIITWELIKDVVLVISETLAAIVAIINILQATNLIQYFVK